MVNGSLTSSAEERAAWLAIKHCCPRPTLTEAAGLATDAELFAQLGHGKGLVKKGQVLMFNVSRRNIVG